MQVRNTYGLKNGCATKVKLASSLCNITGDLQAWNPGMTTGFAGFGHHNFATSRKNCLRAEGLINKQTWPTHLPVLFDESGC